ncbi:MAG: FG-GAP repeat protein [Planctomycetes bacterium]|nr:FG-GAP repeat protein [Planctomycetota bacterium]
MQRSTLPRVLALALALLAPAASAQVLEFQLDGTSEQGLFGHSIAYVGDLTGDGVEEFAVGAPFDGPLVQRRGAVFVYDGATRALVHEWHGLDGWELGHTVARVGDVDQDGTPDVLVDAQQFDSYRGRVLVYSGATGAVLQQRDGLASWEGLGFSLAGLGDVDGDGWPDYAAGGIGSSVTPGRLVVVSGRDGGIHWQVTGTQYGYDFYSIAGLGDVDGDGRGDLVVGTRVFGELTGNRVIVYSGATGAELYAFDGSPGNRIGHTVADAGDVDQDGVHDFLYSVHYDNTLGVYPKARLVSGATGAQLHEWAGTGYFSFFGVALAGAGDQTGDGVPDLLIGQSNASVAPEKLWLVDGATKAYLHGFELGWTGSILALAADANLDGHGANEILVGLPVDGIMAVEGEVRAFSIGCSATPLASFCTSSPNSAGAGATMAWQGSSSVAANDLQLECHGCPPNQFGVFYYGQQEAALPFGDGVRCVSGPVVRLAVVPTGAAGSASFPLDLGALPGGDALLAGARRLFQFWYRDPAFGGAGYNLSDGLAVEFCL